MHHNLQIKFQFHSPNSSINNVAGSIVIDMVRNGEHEYTLNLPTGDIRVWRRSLTTAFPSIDWRSHRHLTATMRGVDKLLELHQKVCTLAAGSGSGWIPVVKAGAGPSDKSCKVRVSDVVYRVNADYDEHEIERRVDMGRAQLFHAFQGFDPALGLTCLGGLGLEAGNVAFHVRTLRLLLLVGLLLLGQTLGTGAFEGAVTPAVKGDFALVHVGDVVDRAVICLVEQGHGLPPRTVVAIA